MNLSIYLDNNYVARPSEKAIQKMLPYFTERWGCPSSPHFKGYELHPALIEGYNSIYRLLGAKESHDFIFTSSGAEAINHVHFATYYDVVLNKGKNQFVTSQIDEAPAIMSIEKLEKFGIVGKMAKANKEGKITKETISEIITPRTAIVSLSWANGLTGVIQPVDEIAEICRERGILLHLDATHILGKLFFELEDIQPDFLTFNGAQIHAPKGTGGLFIKEGLPLTPLISGGLDQGGKRGGNLDTPSFIALAAAAVEALDTRDFLCTEVARLRNKLEEGIMEGFADSFCFFQREDRLPNCTSIAFPGIANEALLFALNQRNVYASVGGGGFQKLSLILEASDVEKAYANTAVSFSLSRETNEEEIDRAIDIIVDTAKRLRKMSSYIVKEVT